MSTVMPIAWVLVRDQGGTIQLTIVNEDEADPEDLQPGKRFEDVIGDSLPGEEGEILHVFLQHDGVVASLMLFTYWKMLPQTAMEIHLS